MVNLTIKGKPSTEEIDVKRFYLPGVILKSECESCNAKHTLDLTHDYLSFPSFNCEESVHFYCDICDHEWSESIILELKVKKVKDV